MPRIDISGGVADSLGGLLRTRPWSLTTLRAHRRDVLYWITFGQGRIAVGGQTRGFGPNVAIAIPAGVVHALHPGPRSQGQVLMMPNVSGRAFVDQPTMLQIDMLQDQAELTALAGHFRDECRATDALAGRASAAYAALLGVWVQRRADQGLQRLPEATGKQTRLAVRFAEMLEETYMHPLGVADCAAALGVTPTHLSRVCQSAWGMAANDLMIQRKLCAARELLADTDMRIGQIGIDLGFGSAAYFNRLFQARTGMTPGAFRRTQKTRS